MKIFKLAIALYVILISCDEEEPKNIAPQCEILTPIENETFSQWEKILITANASDSDGDIVELEISLNNFNIATLTKRPFVFNLNTTSENHTGENVLRISAIDDKGEISEDEVKIHLLEKDLSDLLVVPDFSYNSYPNEVNSSVSFYSDTTNDPYQWYWEFGDGTNSTDQHPTHVYSEIGTYDVSLKITNQYGSKIKLKEDFITICAEDEYTKGFVIDIDGNPYVTVKINNQWWMAQNLSTSKLNDGTEIYFSHSYNQWYYNNKIDKVPKFAYYADVKNRIDEVGALYNGIAVETKKLCPVGWHVSTDDDWKKLETVLGVENIDEMGDRGTDQAKLLKSEFGWEGENNSTNDYNLNILPGGGIGKIRGYFELYQKAYIWSPIEGTIYTPCRQLSFSHDMISRNLEYEGDGFSVRCVRDNIIE